MMKKIYLRVDIDSLKGLTEGIPKLLRLFNKHNIKASFFATLKREGNIYEYIKYRYQRKHQKISHQSFPNSRLKANKNRKAEIFKMLFFPSSLYKHKQIFQDILDQGHELGIHSAIHVKWFSPNYQEAKEDLQEATNIYQNLFNRKPQGFASPYCSWNDAIASAVKESSFDYISIHNDNESPSRCQSSQKLNIPITVSFTDRSIPICEYYARSGEYGPELTNQAEKYIKAQSEKNEFLSTYLHPRIEGIELYDEFSNLIKKISTEFDFNNTFSQLAKNYANT